MTQPHLIEQAKQGDPQAIAALMNKSLQPKGMTALVERQGDRLEVVLEAERVPNRQALTAFVEKGIHNLGIGSIRSIRVLGQQIGAEAPAWTYDLDLQTLTPEFEPEPSFDSDSYMVSEELPPDNFDSDQIPTSPPEPLTSDSDSLFADPAADPNYSFSEETLLSDLSQLQELLSDQPEQPISGTQRQGLEERLKSLWAEQSQEPQDFLAEIMSDESPSGQSDDFLAEQLDADLTSTEDFNSLWPEESASDDPDSLLADTVSIESAASGDFQDFFTESAAEPTDSSAEFWMNEAAEADEPDEILLNFLEEQPTLPSPGVDESGDLLDEPDEILPGFLDQPGAASETGSTSGDLSNDYLSDPQAEDLSALFAEESTQPSDFFTESTGNPDQDFSLGTSDSFQDSSEEEDFLALLEDEPDQEPTLTEPNFFDEQEQTSDEAIDSLFAVPSTDVGVDENGRADYVEGIGVEGIDSLQTPEDDWLAEPMAEPSDATLLEFEEEPAQADFTFDAIDSPEAATDSAASWDQPPIEFLNGEPDLPQPEMPTEQFDSSTTDFESDSQFDFASPLETPSGEQVEGFPQGFLQEFPEASSDENLSDELFVEPHENPFMENMEGRNRESSSDLPPDQQWNQFDPSDWQTTSDDQPLGADDQIGTEDPLSLFSDTTDTIGTTDTTGTTDPTGTTGTTDTTDEALINFFAEESSDISETLGEPNSSWQASEDWQPSETWASETWQPSSDLTESDLGLEGEETTPASSYTEGADYSPDDSSDYLSENWTSSPSSFTSSDDYPDFQFTDNQLDDRPEQTQPSEDFSTFGIAASGTTSLPDTELPNTQLPDTQLPTYEPAYEEPSQAALEEQLADFDMGNQPVAATTPEASAVETEAPPEPRGGSPWLFPLILLGISGWIVGLISFAFLWSRLSSPPPLPDGATTEVPTDGSAPIAAAGVCSAPPETPNSTPVALSNMQFQPNEGNPQQVNLVGCVTNRTQQPIDIVSVLYQAGSGNSSTVGGLTLPDNLIQPGQSVPFSSKFTLPSDTTSIGINTIYWQPAGTTASQETRASITLNR